jgi:hypothetical protein
VVHIWVVRVQPQIIGQEIPQDMAIQDIEFAGANIPQNAGTHSGAEEEEPSMNGVVSRDEMRRMEKKAIPTGMEMREGHEHDYLKARTASVGPLVMRLWPPHRDKSGRGAMTDTVTAACNAVDTSLTVAKSKDQKLTVVMPESSRKIEIIIEELCLSALSSLTSERETIGGRY